MSTEKKRKVIKSQGRAIIASVYKFLQEEYDFMKLANHDHCDLSPLAKITQRTALATGVSERTVSKILHEKKQSGAFEQEDEDPAEIDAPRQRKRLKKDIANIDTKTIRETIQNYHKEHGFTPTLEKLKAEIGFNGCLNTLRSLLLKMGYKWKKNSRNRKALALEPTCESTDTLRLPDHKKTTDFDHNVNTVIKTEFSDDIDIDETWNSVVKVEEE